MAQGTMTTKDRALVKRASALSWHDWPLVADMEEQAESAEARQMLHSIAVAGYHREEASAGMI